MKRAQNPPASSQSIHQLPVPSQRSGPRNEKTTDAPSGSGIHQLQMTQTSPKTYQYKKGKPPQARPIPEGWFCRACGVKETPEIRKGPEGPKTLCNRCGLRWSKKQRAEENNNTNTESVKYQMFDKILN